MAKVNTSLAAIILALLFVVLVFLNNQLLSGLRLDLTQDKVYSLSDGSRQILKQIDEPINLYFFFSDKSSQGMTSLRHYANRVESLLREYVNAANGNLRLHVIDPAPFSEEEDRAAAFGLSAPVLTNAGDALYFGLAATNALDDQQVIAFFDPQQENLLEYQLSKLIYQLSDPSPVLVTLLTDLPVAGGQNPMTGQNQPPWAFYTQLQQLYDVETISSSAESLPEGTQILMLLHPQNLSESLQYQIDQFAMQGGKLLVLLDNHFESGPTAMMGGANQSGLARLLTAYGVEVQPNIVLDALNGLDIRTELGGVAKHMGFIGLGVDQLSRDDVATAGLEVINAASVASIRALPGGTTRLTPLISTSASSDLLATEQYVQERDPQALARLFSKEQGAQVLAARVSGEAKSAFDQALQGDEPYQASTANLNLLLVADVDWLADRFWVQQSNFFGQIILTPFANNGDFITNAVENLSGNQALISIRSRGTFARPFTLVEQLTLQAEKQFREQEQVLQQQLQETEAQLAQLQNQEGGLVLSPEQQAAIDAFVEKKIDIRRALREVRHQLDRDIERLGNWLKFVNIAVAPLLFMLVLWLLTKLLQSRGRL